MSRNIILSYGMGIDSTAVLVRWLTDASSRDFPLSALTVLISQVGDEYPDTYHDVDSLLPMLRANRVRLVQVARPALKTAGTKRYVVLDDSAAPQRIVRSGPVRLSDELARNGTVAQVSHRRCSLRWKGEVLDARIADHMPRGFTHALGYEVSELRRIDRDARIDRHGRQPFYPLHSWGWTRSTSSLFLREVTGRQWRRSCCAHCPFQSAIAGRDDWSRRWAEQPASAALALRLEYTALALNPRMRLFGAHAGSDLAAQHGLDSVLAQANRELHRVRWALYEVRRTFTGPAAAMRSVRVLAEGTRAQMDAQLAMLASADASPDSYGIRRVWLRPPSTGYPRVEHLLVAAPAGVEPKQRPGFEHLWSEVTAGLDGGPSTCGTGG